MISGSDIVIPTRSPIEIAEETVRLIRREWHAMVIEDAATGAVIEWVVPGFQTLPNEFFVYKNEEMKRLWDEEGACESNANTMFHIIQQANQLTIVVDNPTVIVNSNVIGAAEQLARELALGRQEFAA